MKKSSKVILTIVIILLLAVIGVGAFFFVKEKQDNDKKISELEEKINNSKTIENAPSKAEEKEKTSNTVNNENKTNTEKKEEPKNQTKTYSDLKGTYKSQEIDLSEEGNDEYGVYTLTLTEKGTFAYQDCRTDCETIGYYIISNDKITLNSVVSKGNDPSAYLSDESGTLTINSNGTIIDSDKKISGSAYKGNLEFTKKSDTPKEDINIAKVIDFYLAGCSTSGKDGKGPSFSGLPKEQ